MLSRLELKKNVPSAGVAQETALLPYSTVADYTFLSLTLTVRILAFICQLRGKGSDTVYFYEILGQE